MLCFCPLCNTMDARHYWDCGSSCHPGLYLHAYKYRYRRTSKSHSWVCICVCEYMWMSTCEAGRCVYEVSVSPISGTLSHSLCDPWALCMFPHYTSCTPLQTHRNTQVLQTLNAHIEIVLSRRWCNRHKHTHILYSHITNNTYYSIDRSSLTVWTLGQPTFLVPSLSEFSEAPGSTWIIVRVSAEVLTQVKLFVSSRLETDKERENRVKNSVKVIIQLKLTFVHYSKDHCPAEFSSKSN